MASTLHDIKEKLSTTKAAPNHPVGDSVAPPESKQEAPSQGGEGQSFNILPHPAVRNHWLACCGNNAHHGVTEKQ